MKKFIAALCILILGFSALSTLAGCNEENRYFWLDYNGSSYRYENSALTKDLHIGINLDANQTLIGVYTTDGVKVFDENGDVCNLPELKSRLKGKKGVTDRSIPLSVRTEQHTVHFNILLKTSGGAVRWGDEPGDVFFENVTVEEVSQSLDTYLPEHVFRKGSRFSGWKREYGYKDGYYDDWANEYDLMKTLPYCTDGYTLCYQAFYEDMSGWADPSYAVYPYYYSKDHSRWYRFSSPGVLGCSVGKKMTSHLEVDTRRYEDHTRNHTVFKWSIAKNEYLPFDGTVLGDMEIYLYEVDIKSCILNPMTGDRPMEYSVLMNGDTEFTWDVPAPSGYVFAGWYAARDLSGEPVSVSEIPAYDEIEYGMTYYAKWEKTE